MSVRIPAHRGAVAALLNLAQMVQSHALSFFYLASPDLLLGMESDPKIRNVFGVAAAKPELGRAGIALRRFGQSIVELLGDKRIHPGWVIPGGVTEPLSSVKRDKILAMIPEAYSSVGMALSAYKQIADAFKPEIEVFANFPSNYMSLINEEEAIDFTDGALRLIDSTGAIIEDGMTATRFTEVIGEAVEPYSYTKFAYYKPLGYPEGSYRVGPLARLNIVKIHGHAARRKGTRRVQAVGRRTGRRVRSTITTRGWSRCSTALKRSKRFSPTRASSTSMCAPRPASTASRARARLKRRAACSITITKSMKMARSPGRTW
jgi:NAD-reducing hydrogenase large subunit